VWFYAFVAEIAHHYADILFQQSLLVGLLCKPHSASENFVGFASEATKLEASKLLNMFFLFLQTIAVWHGIRSMKMWDE